MASIISTENKRNKLATNHNPYWENISRGRFIGFRKGPRNTSWMARIAKEGKFRATTFKSSDRWDYETALKAANDWFTQMVGVDIDSPEITLADAVNSYEKEKSIEKSPKYARENAARLRKHLSPSIQKTQISQLTRAQIKRFRDNMVESSDDADIIRKSKVSANRVLNLLKAVLNMAYMNGQISTKAEWERVKPFEDVSEARKLYLTDKQANDFLEVTSGAFSALCQACILTGNRVGSLTSALVKDLDMQEKTIRLESRKGTGKVKTWECYLSDDSFQFFKEITRNKLPKAHILTDDNGEPWQKNGYRRTLLAAKIKARMPSDFDLYALRHYYISKALLAGMPAQVVAENCGTSVRMLEKHYAKFMGSDRRAMMNSVALGISNNTGVKQ